MLKPIDAAGGVEMFVKQEGKHYSYWCVWGCGESYFASRQEATDAFLAHRCES